MPYDYDKTHQNWDSSTIGRLEKEYNVLWKDISSYQHVLLSYISKVIQAKDDVADVGCFNGHYLSHIRAVHGVKPFNYLGIDVTEEFIQRARAVNHAQENAWFEQGDIFNLDQKFQPGVFDVVLCSGVLIHLPEIERAIAQLGYIARRDVVMLVQTSETDKTEDHSYSKFLNWYFSDTEMKEAIAKAGLEPVNYFKIPHSAIISGPVYKVYHCTKRRLP